ncbi:MAG: cob(I)yrinic acid a,c-diamide adenosyltransferase [Myxococcota bacterium]
MKLYTKTGDEGHTGLFGGQRVSKAHPRVATYGMVDEANSFIGLAAAALDGDLRQLLEGVMSDLFDLGAELATPPAEDAARKLSERLASNVDAHRIAEIERHIDDADAEVPPLQTFILPTGTDAAARLHVARTLVRRAERAVVDLRARHGEVLRDEVVIYLNRLSDLLFALARVVNHRAGVGDIPWQARKGRGAPTGDVEV